MSQAQQSIKVKEQSIRDARQIEKVTQLENERLLARGFPEAPVPPGLDYAAVEKEIARLQVRFCIALNPKS